MRKVFTSARLENVESVARMLSDAGIEVRITNGRSYKGGIRGNFSYRDEDRKIPEVWVIRSADQPRARAMLREAGLMDSSRNAPDSFLSMGLRGTSMASSRRDDMQRRAQRIKFFLLAVIAVVVALGFFAVRQAAPPPGATPAPAAAAPAATTAPVPEDLIGPGKTPTPDSLAVAMLRGELPRGAEAVVCLAVDGRDPSPALLAARAPSPGSVLPLSESPAASAGGRGAQVVAVGKYEANAAGTGTIFLQRRDVGGLAVPQWYNVRRDGEQWRIVQPL